MGAQIVRSWAGVTTAENAAPYLAHLREATFPHLRSLPGFVGVEVLQRTIDDGQQFRVHTRWESMEHIRAFAGDELEVAVVPPAAQAVLVRYDAHVAHYEVVIE